MKATPRARRRAQLIAHGLLRPHRPRINDPAEGQLSRIETSSMHSLFGDPVTQDLTGAPADHYTGSTRSPQVIVTHPRIEIAVDPQVGISARSQFPSLPNRRGIPGGISP